MIDSAIIRVEEYLRRRQRDTKCTNVVHSYDGGRESGGVDLLASDILTLIRMVDQLLERPK